MDFGEVLSKAWQIIWKHKVLWIFGILAGCASGGGGGGSSMGGGEGAPNNPSSGPGRFPEIEHFFMNLGQWIGEHLWVVVLFAAALVLLIVLSIFLGAIGRIGLIRGTFRADGGAERLVFGELFREGLPFFWRVFGLSFLVGLAFLLILLPVILIGVVTAGVGFLLFIPVICILIPVAWAVSIVVRQANIAMVIENLRMMDGVRRGWNVLMKNPGPILVIWLITLVIGFVAGIVIALPLLVVVVPVFVVYFLGGDNSSYTPLIIAGLCIAAYIPISLAANGLLTAYLESVWTLTYLRLTQPKEVTQTSTALPSNA